MVNLVHVNLYGTGSHIEVHSPKKNLSMDFRRSVNSQKTVHKIL